MWRLTERGIGRFNLWMAVGEILQVQIDCIVYRMGGSALSVSREKWLSMTFDWLVKWQPSKNIPKQQTRRIKVNHVAQSKREKRKQETGCFKRKVQMKRRD